MGGFYGKGAGSELAEGGGSITNHLHGVQPTRQRSILVTFEIPPANANEVVLFSGFEPTPTTTLLASLASLLFTSFFH